jgi:cyclohexanecarboxylate-CoA ligase
MKEWLMRPSDARIEQSVRAGDWTAPGASSGVPVALRARATIDPSRPFIVDRSGSASWEEVAGRSARLASWLKKARVGEGDAVLVQLPNWHEAFVSHVACESVGAVTIPLPPTYGSREIRYIASATEARIALIPETFGRFDYLALYRQLQSALPALERIIVLGGTQGVSNADVVTYSQAIGGDALPEATLEQYSLDPDRIVEIGFTSGSTGDPKGVLHSSNTLCAEHRTWVNAFSLDSSDVLFIPSTVGHQIGFTAMRTTAMIGARLVLIDRWNPETAVNLMEQEGVTFTFTTPAFLYDVLSCSTLRSGSLRSLRTWVLAGQTVSSTLREAALSALPHVRFQHLFGMTEMGCTIMNDLAADPRKAMATGRAQPGIAVQIVGADGTVLAPGVDGELVVNCPSLFLGYFKQADLTAASFTVDGYFRTGDQAHLDAEGYVWLTGRLKDLIKRGGESIPPVEIENTIAKHPLVLEVSVVGASDPRLGERICAFIVTRGNEIPTLKDLTAFAAAMGMPKAWWPERLHIVPSLPRTSIGKIHKAALRALADREP